jgi:putative thioredoxin
MGDYATSRGPALEVGTGHPDIHEERTGLVPSGENMKETDDLHFDTDVIAASRERPVLVDFWAPWCGPCRALGPVLERIDAAMGGAVRIVKVNVDDNPETARRYGVRSIPYVVAFRDGKAVDQFVGALPQAQVQAFVDRQLARVD